MERRFRSNILDAKPKKKLSEVKIKKREQLREIREELRVQAKEQAGPGGIPPEKKKDINRITRNDSS